MLEGDKVAGLVDPEGDNLEAPRLLRYIAIVVYIL